MNTTMDQHIDITVAGILIPRMKIMQAQYKGKCHRTGKWYDPAKAPAVIAFKHKDQLTADQKKAIFGNGQVYHVTVLLDEEETKNKLVEAPAIPHSFKKKDFVPSPFQANILDKMLNTDKHLFIEALAGCGKTQTLVWLINEQQRLGNLRGKRVVYLAFNKSIQEELVKKLAGTGCPAMTTHSFGFTILKSHFKELEKAGKYAISNAKNTDLFLQLISMDLFGDLSEASLKKAKKSDHYKLKGVVAGSRGLVGFIKNWAVIPQYTPDGYLFSAEQREQITKFIEEYQISIPEGFEASHLVDYACRLTAASIPYPGEALTRISFDDMLYLPLALNLTLPKYDLVLTDETQDFNEAQEQMLFKLAANGTRIVSVGDENQAIYRFRGSDTKAFKRIKETLEKDVRGVETCELPINYRSDEAIIEHAKSWVPNIQGRGVALGQQKGEVTHDMTYSQSLQIVNNDGVEEHAFLCRVNVPLVVTAYQLIAQGKRVCIIGRQAIASPMINIIEELCGVVNKKGEYPDNYTNLISDKRDQDGNIVEEGLLSRLAAYFRMQSAKLADEKHEQALDDLTNNVDCIEIIAGRVKTDSVQSVIDEIEGLFTEKTDDKSVIYLSTVHRAKGLEWDNVYILCPHLMPHPNVKPNLDGSWSEDQQQEENIRYVAATRGKHRLRYICNWPFGRGKGVRLTTGGHPGNTQEFPEKPLPPLPPVVQVTKIVTNPPVPVQVVAVPFVDDGEPF